MQVPVSFHIFYKKKKYIKTNNSFYSYVHLNSCPGKPPPKFGLHACDSFTVDPAPNEQAGCRKWWWPHVRFTDYTHHRFIHSWSSSQWAGWMSEVMVTPCQVYTHHQFIHSWSSSQWADWMSEVMVTQFGCVYQDINGTVHGTKGSLHGQGQHTGEERGTRSTVRNVLKELSFAS